LRASATDGREKAGRSSDKECCNLDVKKQSSKINGEILGKGNAVAICGAVIALVTETHCGGSAGNLGLGWRILLMRKDLWLLFD